eukprot:PhF_6_TR25457/c0_g1_i6/m.35255/K14327/UPF2, RENT2; regulator of nonsense transcripts 2
MSEPTPLINPEEVERILERECVSWKESLTQRKALRDLNIDPTSKRLTPAKLKDLKSDMKRTTTFLRRLKDFKSDQKDSVMTDIAALNLTRYVTEGAQNIVAGILEGKIKSADIPTLVLVCSEMHQLYDKFFIDLLTEIRKKWVLSGMAAPADDTQGETRVRVMTRFTTELYMAGVTTEWKLFKWIITQIKDAYCVAGVTPTVTMMALSVVNIVAKNAGPQLYGAGPWPPEDPTPLNIGLSKLQHIPDVYAPAAGVTELKKLVLDFSSSCVQVLTACNDELDELWKANIDVIQRTGELPETLKEQFGAKKKVCDKLYGMIHPLVASHPDHESVALPEVPTLAKLQSRLAPQATTNSIVFLSGLAAFYTVGDIAWSSENMYDTEAEQTFYEEFEELTIPVEDALLEYQQLHKATAEGSDGATTSGRPEPDDDAVSRELDDHLARLSRVCLSKDIPKAMFNWATIFFDSNHALFKYRSTGNKDLGKSFLLACKKRLLRYMKETLGDRMDLLAGLCRLAAMLHQTGDTTICDLGELYVKGVDEDLYRYVIQEPTTGTSELKAKLRLAKIMCEAVKFRIIQTGGILRLLSAGSEENNLKRIQHVPEVIAFTLENCGTFLMRNAMTRQRFESILGNLGKNIRTLGGEFELRIGSAITACRDALQQQQVEAAPAAKLRPSKDSTRTPHERYLRHLLYEELSKHTVNTIISQIFKFRWDDEATRSMILRVLRKAHRIKFTNMPHLATIIRRLSDRHDFVASWIVDDLMETCRQDLEIRYASQRRSPQKRYVDIVLFGELCVLNVVHESTLFYMLYMLCLHRQMYDSGRDYSRIRLITALLDTVYAFFEQATTRKRLQKFLYHFYVLVHSKLRPFPVDINFSIGDTMDVIKSYYPASANFDKFPDTCAEADRLIQKNVYRRGARDKDVVNGYHNFFNYQSMKCLHPISGGFEGVDDADFIEEEDTSVSQPQQQQQGGGGGGGPISSSQQYNNYGGGRGGGDYTPSGRGGGGRG